LVWRREERWKGGGLGAGVQLPAAHRPQVLSITLDSLGMTLGIRYEALGGKKWGIFL